MQLTARESAPIARLGLPDYYWGTNAIHGEMARCGFKSEARRR